MSMAPDEHAQHKDVYAHSLTVLRQAMEQEEDGPDLVLRWAALLRSISHERGSRRAGHDFRRSPK